MSDGSYINTAKIKKKLRISEAKFRALCENVTDKVTKVDATGNIVFTNQVSRTDLEDMVGKSIFEHIPLDQRHALQAALEEARQTGEVQVFNVAIALGGKEEHWTSRVVPIIDKAEVAGFLIIGSKR